MDEKFIGTWKLVSAQYRRRDGTPIEYLGPNPAGMLIYTAGGYMSVHLMRRNRAAFAAGDRLSGTAAEIQSAFEGYHGYYGTFTVDAEQATVTHHLEGSSFPNWVGVDQKRFYELSGDRLILKTPPLQIGGERVEGLLVWERARPVAQSQVG